MQDGGCSSTTENPAGQAGRHRGKRSDLLYVRGRERDARFSFASLRRSRFFKLCETANIYIYISNISFTRRCSIDIDSCDERWTSLEFEKEWRFVYYYSFFSRSCVYLYYLDNK